MQRGLKQLAALGLLAVISSTPGLAQTPPATVSPTPDQIERRQEQLATLPVAPGAGLLRAAPGNNATVERALVQQAGVARTQSVTIDAPYLSALRDGAELRLSRDGQVAGSPTLYVLNLFDDVTVRVAKLEMFRDALDHDVWRGAVVGPDGGEVTLVFDNAFVTGAIRFGGRAFGIQPGPNNTHQVIEYDARSRPMIDNDVRIGPENFLAPETAKQSPASTLQPERTAATVTVSILYVYTAQALAKRPGITSDISMAVARLNKVLLNSGTGVQVTMAGVQQTSYAESASTTMEKVLDDATLGAGAFAAIAEARASKQADLVQVLAVTSDGCGLAWGNTNFDQLGSNLGFAAYHGTSVVMVDSSASCLSAEHDSSTHEVGHNLGVLHDRYQYRQSSENVPGPTGYNYGYIDLVGRFADIMAYGSSGIAPNQCREQGILCPEIPYFSNPNLTYNGRAIGIPDSQATAANGARKIREIAPYVAQLRNYLQVPRLGLTFSGGGGTSRVSADSGFSCTSTCANNTYAPGQKVKLTATPGPGLSFLGWGTNSCLEQTTTPSGGTCTIVMNGWMSASPSFTGSGGGGNGNTGSCGSNIACPVASALIVGVDDRNKRINSVVGDNGGNRGIDCGPKFKCNDSFNTAGARVALGAFPARGWEFVFWRVTDASNGESRLLDVCLDAGDCTFTMPTNGIIAVGATFAPTGSKSTIYLGGVIGSGLGTLTSSPAGVSATSTSTTADNNNCNANGCAAYYPPGTKVTYTATPSAGYVIDSWSNDACPATSSTCTITAATRPDSASRSTVTVNFARAGSSQPGLTVVKAGSGSGTVTSSSGVINCGSACSANVAAGTQVTLTATPDSGSTFTGWSNGCSGTSTCVITISANHVPTATFTNNGTGAKRTISVSASSFGTVTSDPPGINCGGSASACSASFVIGTQAVFTATPAAGYAIGSWYGTCPPRTTCAITVGNLTNVSPYFVKQTDLITLGPVYSSAQSAIQSFLRFYLDMANVVTYRNIELVSASTGASIGFYTTRSVQSNASVQIPISDIEKDIEQNSGSFTKPESYLVRVAIGDTTDYVQHVLYRPSDGTLTNASACGNRATSNAKRLINVHSSLLDFGFPSTIVVTNTGSSAASPSLGVYEAVDGRKVGNGNYVVPSIPAGGQARIAMSTIEAAIGFAAKGQFVDTYQYVIKVENTFTGFLQHLVTNKQAGVITDMTTLCESGDIVTTAVTAAKLASVYSTSQSTQQSFLRFHNSGTSAGTVRVTLGSETSGASLAQWTSPSIAAGASRQFSVDEIERGTGQTFTKPSTYSLTVQPSMTGYVQHVLYRPADGTLTNLSTCENGVTANSAQLINVHSSLLDFGYPSTIVAVNTGSDPAGLSLGLYDATTGTKLGSGNYAVSAVAPGGQARVDIKTIESALGYSPKAASLYHYVIKVEGSFTGYLQHLVTNIRAGVITDMTTVCRLN